MLALGFALVIQHAKSFNFTVKRWGERVLRLEVTGMN